MKTWITSDIHLNHLQILKYCPHRWTDNDGFSPPDWTDVAESNLRIISNWNSLIAPEDEVWVLGDFAMGLIVKAPPLIRALNGIKHLVKGNHDSTLCRNIKRGDEDFQGLFASIQDYKELSHVVDGKKHMICMSHYPMQSFNGMNQGTIMAHGHLHGSPSGLTGRIKDVGMDTNNLFPYLLDDVVREMLTIDIIRDHH